MKKGGNYTGKTKWAGIQGEDKIVWPIPDFLYTLSWFLLSRSFIDPAMHLPMHLQLVNRPRVVISKYAASFMPTNLKRILTVN